MADALLSLATDLLKQLGTIAVQQAQQEINLIVGVDEEIEKLSNSFKIVQALLNDAEERQLTEAAVKLWLDQLRDVYYMMDDVLDEWNTARIKSETQKEEERAVINNNPAALKKKKVPCSFFPSLSCCFRQVDNLSLRREIGHKVENLKQTLDNILKDKVTYGFDLTRHSHVEVERPTTTSFVDVSDIIGRDNYRDELLSNLLGVGSQEERNPRVISLVGMGGIGKSTLAQLAYNHSKIQAHFEVKIWICVSDPFDQCKVAKAIIQEIDPKHESLNKVTEFQTLLREINDLIGEKRFFLVLDDVWTDDFTKWESFRKVLKCGAQGSRILVTTRKNRVAEMMESSHTINLGVLSLDDCWLMFSKIAFSNKDIHQRMDLEELGKKLANKCKGLPLAAKTLGIHMRGKRSKEEWERVLHNNLWEVEDIEKGLLGPLLLSYNELSLSEKQCFLCCVVFEKDHEFDRLELIVHWMAQGYINSKGNMEMEEIAEEYFQKLAMCSFFQDFKKDENDGRIESCKMHDIVHDFAQSMTKDVCLTSKGDEEVNINFKRARQLSLEVKEIFPESIYEAKNLRFLKLDLMSSEIVQPKLFDNLTCLRTLHLEGRSILELPNEVEKLTHLRLLKLSCQEIEELPESICNLCNLQSLDVSWCWALEKLPQGIGKLINLRHLLLEDEALAEFRIKSFPKGIGRLTCLKTLTYFPVGGKGEEICKSGELEHLNHIQGKLQIVGLSNVVDFGAIENTLKKKKDLRDLVLRFNTLGVHLVVYALKQEEETEEERRGRKMEKDVAILNALEPPPRLENLAIGFSYKGTTMCPNWMMSKLTYLKTLALGHCPNLEQLPPLGKLPLLEVLLISEAPMIRKAKGSARLPA
ncbi:putative disease resistance protein RGA3 [Quercus lobata]|uniref:putative disease resistance protein RGA3 n=1 Tax=Quercus lobata TaxID=97700 RepID=UPI001244CB3D|nr:putative disease resistance protein RGA3 [Quercus lobata]